MSNEQKESWGSKEFDDLEFGDKRLNARLVSICDRFSDSPESSINQACEDWAETKAAYRFFQNEKVEAEKIMASHQNKTRIRAQKYKTVLAIQDTSYFIYTHHPKTEGLNRLNITRQKNSKLYSDGLLMHTCLGVTTEGLPIGLFDQKLVQRDADFKKKGAKRYDVIPIEEKESYKWLETLRETEKISQDTQIVTVCDREADLYDFFHLSDQLNAPVLVRASHDRVINRKSTYTKNNTVKLWDYMEKQPISGSYDISIPKKKKKHKVEEARTASVSIQFAPFRFSPPRNHMGLSKEKLPDIKMFAIYVSEINPPDDVEPVEWMLVTNLPINSFDEACEKVSWYCLRWRIEMFFKILKSGFKVEDCRLGNADRLRKYLTVMSVVAWRLFTITLIARTDPDRSCTEFLSDNEWCRR